MKTTISYAQASEVVQAIGIKSRTEYLKWHKAVEPKNIPRYPARAYSLIWTSWNHFLGNDNKFMGKRCNRPKRGTVTNES